MAFFRICKNDITDVLRETFNASPLRVPEARVQPLIVIGKKGEKVNFRGQLRFLLENEPELDVPFESSKMANAAFGRSRTISLDFGIKILEGFLQGLGISAAPIGAKLKGVKEISFSFTNARRLYIDPGQLGNAIKGKMVDLQHPSVGIFTKQEDPFEMLLISDAIVSRSFTINIEKANEHELEGSLPALQQQIADMDAKVKVDIKSNRSITFEGDEDLTFAFACVKLELDKQSGALQIGETVLTKGGGKVEKSPYTPIDEDEFEPGMIEWE
jgi:hypothetical protein